MLVDGVWQGHWNDSAVRDQNGDYVRPLSSVRNWITADGSAGPTGDSGFAAEPGRYHLYVALICPWACRTLITRHLKNLTDVISVSVVSPVLTDDGWQFDATCSSPSGFEFIDPLYQSQSIYQLYQRHDRAFTGRATVPLLWDKEKHCMVNNESADIIRMLNSAFEQQSPSQMDLYPAALQTQIEQLNELFYSQLNNGVYQAGFAQSQAGYEAAYDGVFAALDAAEQRLQQQRYLLGDILTEADVRLFVSLIRFDSVYNPLFKCNKKRIADYPNLRRYCADLYRQPAFYHSVDFAHIKRGYYSVKVVNPTGTVPKGPDLDYLSLA